MGVLCLNLHPGTSSPLLFYSPSTAATQFTAAPVILAPSYSAACDFSTPVWVWAVVGTCLFLFCGAFDVCVSVRAFRLFSVKQHLFVISFATELAHTTPSVAVWRTRLDPHVPQAQGRAPHV